MEKFKWIIFSGITISILVFLVVFSNGSKIDVTKIDANAVQVASDQNGSIADHTYGKIGSKVTLIEYGDYQCPGCGAVNPSIKIVIEQYKDQLQFVFRNFPLTSAHPNAKSSAAAVEAAGLQGKYWEMHNKIYATQSDWENLDVSKRTDYYVSLAKEFNLDTNKFTTDMSSSNIDKKISYDQAIGFKAKVDSTPSFFLNGTLLSTDNWSDSTKLKTVIDAELTKNGIALPTQL